MKFTNQKIFSVSISAILVIFAISSTFLKLNPSTTESKENRAIVDRPHYQIDATYDDQNQVVKGKMRVDLPESRTDPQKEVYFHLYPNVFQNWKYNKESKPQKPGFIKIQNVKVDGSAVKQEIQNEIMKVALPQELGNGKSARIEMDYTLQLPKGGTRLNTFKHTAFLAQWYPMLSVKDKEGWHNEPYTSIGDPFYTNMSDFDVTFHVPEGYQVISTAKDPITTKGGEIKLTQHQVRDFAAVITKDYQVVQGKSGNIQVNLWYLAGMDDVKEELHKAAVDGMKFFGERFGSYPYEEIDVVLGETGYGIAGMEYPGLVTSVPKAPSLKGEVPAVNVVAHELAHQWWYGVVGSNQAKEPWLDEGLTSFSEFLYMKKQKGENGEEWLKKVVTRTDQIHDSLHVHSAQRLYDYSDEVYGLMVYLRPTAMMFDLVKQIGEDKVMKIMSTYYQKFQYRTATTKDFIRIASEVSGKDLTSFFDQWLYFKEDDSKSKKSAS
ncbi:Peptidase family M1 [Thermoactinomyces sp. DSM 45891]|uniref:M1 family metallopeptidase n=1 Tax=Thermoactinomyces sp. DSM 45891 TaxID=1761907 RepID=UPI0009106E9A|nr:M1 family metallopeptidase [Thermoactinomyces sp. DSM 45891]SFX66947.1 Peptidase family M1 [Thermoactinomyces sp. DSM 45891]